MWRLLFKERKNEPDLYERKEDIPVGHVHGTSHDAVHGKGRVQKSRLRFSGLVVSGHRTDRAYEKLIDFLGLPLVLFVFSLGGYIVAAEEKINGIRISLLVSLPNIFIEGVQ